jgi:hypothetical protein
MSFCIKFKYLEAFFVPELSGMADITQRVSQARKPFNSNRQVHRNKELPIDIRKRLYQAMIVNIALWGSEAGLRKKRTGLNWKRFTAVVSEGPKDVQVDDMGYRGETDPERKGRRTAKTHTQWSRWWNCEDADGFPNSSQWKSQDLGGECLAQCVS